MKIETNLEPNWNRLSEAQKNQIESDISNYKQKGEYRERLKIPFPPDAGNGLLVDTNGMQAGLAFWEKFETQDGIDYKLYDIQ